MRHNFTDKNGKAGKIMSQFAAQKKKSAVAVILIVVMAFMWFKVLKSESPKSTRADVLSSAAGSQAQQSSSELKVSFVKLPFVPGRHDVLSRDFFRMDPAMFGSAEQVNFLPSSGGDNVKRIAEMLRLDAIVTGAEPEAFINDKLLKVGEIIIVPDGVKKYECEVTAIEENLVVVKVEGTEVELKLKDRQDVSEQ